MITRMMRVVGVCAAAWACDDGGTAAIDVGPAPPLDSAVDVDAAGPGDDAGVIADAILDAAPRPDAEPWPSPTPPIAPGITLVFDGQLVADGEIVRIPGPPAGLDAPIDIEIVLTWRGEAPLEFDTEADGWLAADGFSWAHPPPAGLAPGASARLGLIFDPTIAGAAGVHPATLTVPGAGTAIDLEVELPRPLRMVFVGGAGELFVSDAYGFETRQVADAMGPTTRHGIAWGEGRFFRSWATGGEWGDPGAYAFSDDGIEWVAADAAPEFWSSGCAWGIDRFACAVGDRLAWSRTGAAVVHEATTWGGMLHAIRFIGDRWVAVGRQARRVVSLDGESWINDTTIDGGDGDDWFFAVDGRPDGLWVAVGGQDSTLIATSRDQGESWQITRDEAGRGATSVACLPDRCVLGRHQEGATLLVTDDGESWAPVELGDWTNYRLLGTANGWFIAAHIRWQEPTSIMRSRDGIEWTAVYTTDAPVDIVGMAIERWEPSR